jgi:hypothetical protein
MNQYTSQIRLICDHLQGALVPLRQLEDSREDVPFYSSMARKLLEPVESFLTRMGAEVGGFPSDGQWPVGTTSEAH